ncbi:hypothetical protein ABW20_dc0110436 [Dactylellina cionopaga]|nr:hypothetical protein ABW20_dc0110436 [Dactylellina cionopaga]
MVDKMAGNFTNTFSEAIRIIEEEERRRVEERRQAAMTGPDSNTNSRADSLFSVQNGSAAASGTTVSKGSNDKEFSDSDLRQELPPREELEKEYTAYAEEFIATNFKGLLDPNSNDFKETMAKAAERAQEIMREYGLDPKDTKKLTKLALYDFAILCGKLPY